MKNNKQIMTWVTISIFLVLIWFFGRGDDKEQIANEIKEHWNVVKIQHIEVLADNKSVAFFKTVDGTEREMYLEKSLFSWDNKKDFSFVPSKGTNKPIFLSFFDSPFRNEEEHHTVLLRVSDNEIAGVKIVKKGDVIHNFKLFSMGSGERFGLFRTESDAIYKAEFIADNSEGEAVLSSKLSE